MKSISSRDYYIPFNDMVSYAKSGKLRIGIDRLTGQQLTNNEAMIKHADDPALLRSTWKAHNFWTYLMLASFGYTVYLSFVASWWWFIVGFVGMGILNPILVKSNEENLIEVLMKDKTLYEAMITAKRLNFLVDESLLSSLHKGEVLPEIPVDKPIKQKESIKSSTKDEWDIINDYSIVMEKADWLSAFYDIAELPHPKYKIRDALINKYNESNEPEHQKILKTGLLALSHFQENVGSEPVRGAVDISTLHKTDDLSQMAQQMKAEEEKLDKELFDALSLVGNREYQSNISKLK